MTTWAMSAKLETWDCWDDYRIPAIHTNDRCCNTDQNKKVSFCTFDYISYYLYFQCLANSLGYSPETAVISKVRTEHDGIVL